MMLRWSDGALRAHSARHSRLQSKGYSDAEAAAAVASATHMDLGRRPARRSSWCHGQRGRVAYASDVYIRTTVHQGSTRVDGWMLLGGIEQHGLALMGPPLALMGPADSLNVLDE